MNGGHDIVGRPGPSKRSGRLVVMIQIASYSLLKRGHRPVRASSQLMHGQGGEEAFDLIEPGRTGRSEVAVISRMPQEPIPHLFGLVRAVVVQHEMHLQIGGHASVDLSQKVDELAASVSAFDLADHPAGSDIQGTEQIGRAVSLVVAGPGVGQARSHRQDRPCSVERLNLTLLVHAQYQGLVGRVHVQAHDISYFLDEMRVRRELEGPGQVGLYAEGAPHPVNEISGQGKR